MRRLQPVVGRGFRCGPGSYRSATSRDGVALQTKAQIQGDNEFESPPTGRGELAGAAVYSHGAQSRVGDGYHLHPDNGRLALSDRGQDVFTCEIVGYAMGERMTQELTGRALFQAVQRKRPADGLVHLKHGWCCLRAANGCRPNAVRLGGRSLCAGDGAILAHILSCL